MIIIPTNAFPLTWPGSQPRTANRRRSSFIKPSLAGAYDQVRNELKLAGARTVVISCSVPLRGDGQIYSDEPGGRTDPGVAVYWTRMVRGALVPHVIACDRWQKVAENMHALALSIDAMRGQERWGAVTLEQAFAGFAALPPGSSPAAPAAATARPWREVLGGGWPVALPADLLAIARARYRAAIADAHPDRPGGSHERAAEINAAIDQAEAELAR